MPGAQHSGGLSISGCSPFGAGRLQGKGVFGGVGGGGGERRGLTWRRKARPRDKHARLQRWEPSAQMLQCYEIIWGPPRGERVDLSERAHT